MIEELEVNLNDLTLQEGEDFEELTGIMVASLGPDSKLPMKALSVLAWIVKRRTDPDFTLADARQIKLSSFLPKAAGGAPRASGN